MPNPYKHLPEAYKERIRAGMREWSEKVRSNWRAAECKACGKLNKFRPSRFSKSKNLYCNTTCYAKHLTVKLKGEGNHFYGKRHTMGTRVKISVLQGGLGSLFFPIKRRLKNLSHIESGERMFLLETCIHVLSVGVRRI